MIKQETKEPAMHTRKILFGSGAVAILGFVTSAHACFRDDPCGCRVWVPARFELQTRTVVDPPVFKNCTRKVWIQPEFQDQTVRIYCPPKFAKRTRCEWVPPVTEVR